MPLDLADSMTNRPALLSKNRAARTANLSRKQFENVLRNGLVDTFDDGSRVWIRTQSLEALIARLNAEHGAAA